MTELDFAPQEVHIWSVSLDQPPQKVEELAALLAPDEMARAERFRFERHRRRFIVGRGVLRRMLGSYLGLAPEVLEFRYGEKGKPSLGERCGGRELFFNLSHSEERALYGLTLGQDLGVDIEHLRPMPDAESIAERFFSIPERETLRTIPGERKAQAFFNCWTRKEAYIKATGDGLSMPLDRFEVSLAPDEEARMKSVEGDPNRGEEWSLFHFLPAPDYIGALCIHGGPWKPTCRDWEV